MIKVFLKGCYFTKIYKKSIVAKLSGCFIKLAQYRLILIGSIMPNKNNRINKL